MKPYRERRLVIRTSTRLELLDPFARSSAQGNRTAHVWLKLELYSIKLSTYSPPSGYSVSYSDIKSKG